MKLRSMLAVPTAAIFLITLLLVASFAASSWRSWQRSEAAAAHLEQLHHLMQLQEMMGLERAATSDVLSLRRAATSERKAVLLARRQAVDLHLRALFGLPRLSGSARHILPMLSERLETVRTKVDTVVEQPIGVRTAADIRAALGGLLALAPQLFPAIDDAVAEVAAADSNLAPLLTAIHASADLRLYAGTMLGRFAVALIEQRPFNLQDITGIRVEQGQMIELHRLLLANIRIAGVVQSTADVITTMERRVFVEAEGMYDHVIAAGMADGRFDMTHPAVMAEYIPALNALVAVRDTLMQLAHQRLEQDEQQRLWWLERTVAAGATVLLSVLAALVMAHLRVIRPLAALAAMVIRLSEGDRSVRLPIRQGSQEIADLAHAIEVLRKATLAADAEAARRSVELRQWKAHLQTVLATIDLLHDRTATMTGLLPVLLEQLDALAAEDGSVPGLADAIAATRTGIAVLAASSGRLDAALERMHEIGGGSEERLDELKGAMEDVADVVATIEASVNGLPQITLCAMRDLPRRMLGGPALAALDRILNQVQEMAAAAGGLQTALLQAHQGVGELVRLRA